MNGEIRAPKRVRIIERSVVPGNQATAQAAHAFQVDWTGLPEGLIPKIGLFLNKQEVMRLRCMNTAFRRDLDASETIKRPLKEIRGDFKQEVGALTSGAPILPYMYDHVQKLTGHTAAVFSITQLTDDRIVSGSDDETLRVWDLEKSEGEDGFVRELNGHTSWINSVTQLTDGRIVSGSLDKTLRVWGYVSPETGDAL